MSTLFGIYLKEEPLELIYGELPSIIYESWDDWENDFEKVAFRFNSGCIMWENPLARFLPNDMKVYPMDNAAQGIFTIGDIKKEMENYE